MAPTPEAQTTRQSQAAVGKRRVIRGQPAARQRHVGSTGRLSGKRQRQRAARYRQAAWACLSGNQCLQVGHFTGKPQANRPPSFSNRVSAWPARKPFAEAETGGQNPHDSDRMREERPFRLALSRGEGEDLLTRRRTPKPQDCVVGKGCCEPVSRAFSPRK
jgi:hypothetical protein